MCFVSCASVVESLNSSNYDSLNRDCDKPPYSFNALLESCNKMCKKPCTIDLDTEHIMNELI